VVVRRGFSHDLADLLLADLRRVLPRLEVGTGGADPAESTAFAH
jgi:glutamate decarboxylase